MRCICPRTPSVSNGFAMTRIRCTRERARRSRILQARKRPGLRKDPGLFVSPFTFMARPGGRVVAIDGSRLRQRPMRMLFDNSARGVPDAGRDERLALCGRGAAGSAQRCQRRGQGFDPRRPLHLGCARAQASGRPGVHVCRRGRAGMQRIAWSPGGSRADTAEMEIFALVARWAGSRLASFTQRPECRPVSAEAAGSTPARRARSRKPLRLHRCRTDGCEPSVRRVFDIPSWRNWQTRLAQNQESRDVSVRIGPRGPVFGWLAERSKAPVLKTGEGESPSRVRIYAPPAIDNAPLAQWTERLATNQKVTRSTRVRGANSHRRLAQLAEHRLDKAGVAGSEPAASTTFPITHLGVAQLAAHRVWDARVAGSNPAAETIRSMVHVAQWKSPGL